MECRDRNEDFSLNRKARIDRDRVARLQPSQALESIDCAEVQQRDRSVRRNLCSSRCRTNDAERIVDGERQVLSRGHGFQKRSPRQNPCREPQTWPGIDAQYGQTISASAFDSQDVGQILDGLRCRQESWADNQRFTFVTGTFPMTRSCGECSDPVAAEAPRIFISASSRTSSGRWMNKADCSSAVSGGRGGISLVFNGLICSY